MNFGFDRINQGRGSAGRIPQTFKAGAEKTCLLTDSQTQSLITRVIEPFKTGLNNSAEQAALRGEFSFMNISMLENPPGSTIQKIFIENITAFLENQATFNSYEFMRSLAGNLWQDLVNRDNLLPENERTVFMNLVADLKIENRPFAKVMENWVEENQLAKCDDLEKIIQQEGVLLKELHFPSLFHRKLDPSVSSSGFALNMTKFVNQDLHKEILNPEYGILFRDQDRLQKLFSHLSIRTWQIYQSNQTQFDFYLVGGGETLKILIKSNNLISPREVTSLEYLCQGSNVEIRHRGSFIQITVPAKPKIAAPASLLAGQTPIPGRKLIIYVEDEDTIWKLFSSALLKGAAELSSLIDVERINSPEKFRQEFSTNLGKFERAALIIMDLMLTTNLRLGDRPTKLKDDYDSGLGLIKMIRNRLPRVKIIILSNRLERDLPPGTLAELKVAGFFNKLESLGSKSGEFTKFIRDTLTAEK